MSEVAKKGIAFSVLLFLVAITVVFAYRIILVNDVVFAHERVSFRLEEEATLPAYQKLEALPYDPGIRIAARGCELVGIDWLEEYYPAFAQSFAQTNPEMTQLGVKWLIVEADVRNVEAQETKGSLQFIRAQSGAWVNGVDMMLFATMNEGVGSMVSLGSNETRKLRFPFLIAQSQFGFNDTWARLEERDFELVLATSPDKIFIELGKPGATYAAPGASTGL